MACVDVLSVTQHVFISNMRIDKDELLTYLYADFAFQKVYTIVLSGSEHYREWMPCNIAVSLEVC